MSIPREGIALVPPSRQTRVMAAIARLTPFSEELRFWRNHHRLTQLDLAAAAQTTTRHLSFLETGKSRPSKQMVERLCEAMQVPIRERNALFVAAGLAPPHGDSDLRDPALDGFLAAVDALLERHGPYPGYAFDRGWNIVRANAAAVALAGGPSANVIELLFGGPWQELVANWPQVAWATLDRLRRDLLADPRNADLDDLVEHARRSLEGTPRPDDPGSDLAICPVLRIGHKEVRTVTLTASFGAPRHTATDELRVDLYFPERSQDAALLVALTGSGS